jgi:hypothetical protein
MLYFGKNSSSGRIFAFLGPYLFRPVSLRAQLGAETAQTDTHIGLIQGRLPVQPKRLSENKSSPIRHFDRAGFDECLDQPYHLEHATEPEPDAVEPGFVIVSGVARAVQTR